MIFFYLKKNARRLCLILIALCLLVGLVPFGAFAATTDNGVEFLAQQLTLGDDLTMNFVLGIDEAVATQVVVDLTVDGSVTSYDKLTANAEGNYTVSIDVAAAQMTKDIQVAVKVNGTAVAERTYSVRQYADAILKGNYTKEAKDLVKEMLNYGAKAQTYFNYNVENYADAGLEAVAPAVMPAEAPEIAVEGKVAGISYYGSSMLFTGKLAVRYYFTAPNGVEDYTFTANGNSYEAKQKDGLYYVDVAGINPQDIDESVVLTVSKESSSLSISYGPMNYIVRICNGTGSQSMKALLQAIYGYHLAAEIYVEKGELETTYPAVLPNYELNREQKELEIVAFWAPPITQQQYTWMRESGITALVLDNKYSALDHSNLRKVLHLCAENDIDLYLSIGRSSAHAGLVNNYAFYMDNPAFKGFYVDEPITKTHLENIAALHTAANAEGLRVIVNLLGGYNDNPNDYDWTYENQAEFEADLAAGEFFDNYDEYLRYAEKVFSTGENLEITATNYPLMDSEKSYVYNEWTTVTLALEDIPGMYLAIANASGAKGEMLWIDQVWASNADMQSQSDDSGIPDGATLVTDFLKVATPKNYSKWGTGAVGITNWYEEYDGASGVQAFGFQDNDKYCYTLWTSVLPANFDYSSYTHITFRLKFSNDLRAIYMHNTKTGFNFISKMPASSVDKDWLVTLGKTNQTAHTLSAKMGQFVATTAYHNGGNINYHRQPSEADIRWQYYAALAYGATSIDEFVYTTVGEGGEFSATDHGSIWWTDVNDYNTYYRTDVYYAAQAVHQEIAKFDHVLLSFNWQGVMVNAVNSHKATTAALNNAVGVLPKHHRVNSILSTKDLLVGCFQDANNYDGFLLVNFDETLGGNAATNNVSVKFNKAYTAVVYVKGERQVVALNDGVYTCELKPGEAVFVIPVEGDVQIQPDELTIPLDAVMVDDFADCEVYQDVAGVKVLSEGKHNGVLPSSFDYSIFNYLVFRMKADQNAAVTVGGQPLTIANTDWNDVLIPLSDLLGTEIVVEGNVWIDQIFAHYLPVEQEIPEGAVLVADYSTAKSPWNNPNWGSRDVGITAWYESYEGVAGVQAFGMQDNTAVKYTMWTSALPDFDYSGYSTITLRLKINKSAVRAVYLGDSSSSVNFLSKIPVSNEWTTVTLSISELPGFSLMLSNIARKSGEVLWIDQIYVQ